MGSFYVTGLTKLLRKQRKGGRKHSSARVQLAGLLENQSCSCKHFTRFETRSRNNYFSGHTKIDTGAARKLLYGE
jgi:hypothetical protein